MKVAMYPGTFDPITYGHIDIAVRALNIFPKVIAVVAENPGKSPLFSVDERLAMVKEAFKDITGIEVVKYSGLIVNCLQEYGASVLIRGCGRFPISITNSRWHLQTKPSHLIGNSVSHAQRRIHIS